MRSGHPPWQIALACGVVGLFLAATVLDGSVQGLLGVVSLFTVLFAIVRGLDSPDFRNRERLVEKDALGSGEYHSGTGTRIRSPSPIGPVNTPQQDSIDALERTWRASPPADD